MINRTTLPLLALLATTTVAAQELHTDALTCAGELPAGTELRITYGPFWDGAWQLSVTRPEGDVLPEVRVDTLEVARADFTATVVESHSRPGNTPHLRALRRASIVMIESMDRYADESPELASERRPLTVQVKLGADDACAEGYINWPRIPGTYYFEAIDTLREAVLRDDSTYDPWPAIRLQLRQVTGSWAR